MHSSVLYFSFQTSFVKIFLAVKYKCSTSLPIAKHHCSFLGLLCFQLNVSFMHVLSHLLLSAQHSKTMTSKHPFHCCLNQFLSPVLNVGGLLIPGFRSIFFLLLCIYLCVKQCSYISCQRFYYPPNNFPCKIIRRIRLKNCIGEPTLNEN